MPQVATAPSNSAIWDEFSKQHIWAPKPKKALFNAQLVGLFWLPIRYRFNAHKIYQKKNNVLWFYSNKIMF